MISLPADQVLAWVDALDANPHLDPAARARAQAYLVRHALERACRALLIRKHAIPELTTFHAQFLALPAVIDPGLAREAEQAWSALSRFCHPRDEPLPPSLASIRRYASVARRLTKAG